MCYVCGCLMLVETSCIERFLSFKKKNVSFVKFSESILLYNFSFLFTISLFHSTNTISWFILSLHLCLYLLDFISYCLFSFGVCVCVCLYLSVIGIFNCVCRLKSFAYVFVCWYPPMSLCGHYPFNIFWNPSTHSHTYKCTLIAFMVGLILSLLFDYNPNPSPHPNTNTSYGWLVVCFNCTRLLWNHWWEANEWGPAMWCSNIKENGVKKIMDLQWEIPKIDSRIFSFVLFLLMRFRNFKSHTERWGFLFLLVKHQIASS